MASQSHEIIRVHQLNVHHIKRSKIKRVCKRWTSQRRKSRHGDIARNLDIDSQREDHVEKRL